MTRKERALTMYTRAINQLHRIMTGETEVPGEGQFIDITPLLTRSNKWQDKAREEGATDEEIDKARAAGITD